MTPKAKAKIMKLLGPERGKLWVEAQEYGERIGRSRAFRELAEADDSTKNQKLLERLNVAENVIDWIVRDYDNPDRVSLKTGERFGVDGHAIIVAREQIKLRGEKS